MVDINWVKLLNTPVSVCSQIITQNYYAPLTSQVDKLEKINIINFKWRQMLSTVATNAKGNQAKLHVRFTLSSNHIDKNSREWRRKKGGRTDMNLQQGVLDGSIPSACSDTGASESAFKPSDPTIATGIASKKSFGGAFGDLAEATTINKLHHMLREPARSVHIAPQVQDSLLSTGKCANADYFAVYNKHKVNYYNAKTTKLTVSIEAVLTG